MIDFLLGLFKSGGQLGKEMVHFFRRLILQPAEKVRFDNAFNKDIRLAHVFGVKAKAQGNVGFPDAAANFGFDIHVDHALVELDCDVFFGA